MNEDNKPIFIADVEFEDEGWFSRDSNFLVEESQRAAMIATRFSTISKGLEQLSELKEELDKKLTEFYHISDEARHNLTDIINLGKSMPK